MREASKIMTKAAGRAMDLDKQIAAAKKDIAKGEEAVKKMTEKLTKLLVRKNKLAPKVAA